MNNKKEMKARILLQQCLSASVKHKQDGEIREIGKGVVVYVCFYEGFTEDLIERVVNTILNVKLTEANNSRLVSVKAFEGDILIIPQATLGGTLKSTTFQYHHNLEKPICLRLYEEFVQMTRDLTAGSMTKVEAGVFGERQILKMDTFGPFSHIVEF